MAPKKRIEIQNLLGQADGLIRSGQGVLAGKSLEEILRMRPAREAARAVAEIARRCSRSDLGLKVLNSIVRPTHRKPMEATDAEKAEYAANLIRLGAVAEAFRLLAEVRAEKTPEALLFEAYGHISLWDYDRAIPLLERYIEAEVTDYQRLLARVNLVAAFVVERRHPEACKLLEALFHQVLDGEYGLLHGNLYEIGAQLALAQNDFDRAERYLKEATERLVLAGGRDPFYVQKWRAFLNFKKDPADTRGLLSLRGVAREASQQGLWETVRSCDRMEAVVLGKQALMVHLYFGTPLYGFRKKLLSESECEIPELYGWVLCPGKRPVELDCLLEDAQMGRTHLSLLSTLASDFYRPQRIAELHAQIYPGEYYNPLSAPLRVRQAVHRLRNYISERRWPIGIDEISSAYRLAADCPVILWRPRVQRTTEEMQILKLQRHYERTPFSTSEAAKWLGISVRGAFSLLNDGVARGVLQKLGRGASSRYGFRERSAKLSETHKRAV